MPGDLITGYLAGLGGRLPASVTEEIAGGLADAREHYLASGLSGQDADRAAIAEFGDPARLAAELTRHAPGRRAARILLATGQLASPCWAAALITSRAWTWPVPAAARLAFGAALLVTIAALGAAAAEPEQLPADPAGRPRRDRADAARRHHDHRRAGRRPGGHRGAGGRDHREPGPDGTGRPAGPPCHGRLTRPTGRRRARRLRPGKAW